MHVFIDGKEVRGDIVGPPAMNFSQHWRWEGHRRCLYVYRLPLSEFITSASAWFEEFRQDEIRTHQVEDNDGYPQLEEYRLMGFPPLEELAHQHPILLGKLMKFRELDLLNGVGGSGNKDGVYYTTNSLDSIEIGSDIVEFRGIAYLNRVRSTDDIVITCPAEMGRMIGVALGLFVTLPLGWYVAARFLPASYFSYAFYAAFFLMALTMIFGGNFAKRCKFRFRKDAGVVEVTTIRLVFPGQTLTVPFSAIRTIEVRSNHDGSPTLEMLLMNGKRWILRHGTLRKLRMFAKDIGSLLGWSTHDGMHWS